jgi:hypothetical protein
MPVPESNAAIAKSYRNAKCKKIQTSRTPSVGNQDVSILLHYKIINPNNYIKKLQLQQILNMPTFFTTSWNLLNIFADNYRHECMSPFAVSFCILV